MTQEQLLVGIILAIVGHGVAQLFGMMKSPKEVSGEIINEVRAVRSDHELLARRFERHDEIVKNLINALDRLTLRIDRLEPHLVKPANGRVRSGP